MVYVDPKNLGYKPFWERWINALANDGDRKEFTRLFDKYVPQCISLILEGFMDGRQGEKLRTIVPLSNLNLVRDKLVQIQLFHITSLYALLRDCVCVLLLLGNQI